MADRSVVVHLKGDITDLAAKMTAAGASMRQFTDDAQKHAAKNSEAWQKAGVGLLAVGGMMEAGFALAVKASADFDQKMSGVAAVTNATGREMDQMRKAAIDAGRDTVFSASQAAEAEAELAKAGISTADIMGGALSGSLSLAAAGQLDLKEAATISAQAMNIFGLAGKDVGHIADVLAAGANKSAADVGQLAYSLRMGGLVAKQTGLSFEETTGAFAAFADNALVGSDAGTSFKTMLQALTPNSAAAAGEMKALGFSAYDSEGKFVGLEETAGRLQTSFKNLTPEARNSAMEIIFGSDGVRAATILYQEGASGIREYTDAVNDQGAAALMSAKQLNNLKGDLEQLGGSFETALIQSGSGANGVLREMTQAATSVVNAYSAMPEPVQSAIAVVSGLGGAIAITGGAALIAVPKIQAFNVALSRLGVSGTTAIGVIGKLGMALGILAGAYIAAEYTGNAFAKAVGEIPVSGNRAVSAMRDISKGADITEQDMKRAGAGTTDFKKAMDQTFNRNAGENISAFFNNIGSLGGKLPWGKDAVDDARNAFKTWDDGLSQLTKSGHADQAAAKFAAITEEAKRLGVPIDKLVQQFPQYTDAVHKNSEAQKYLAPNLLETGSAANQAKIGLGAMTDATEAQKQEAKELEAQQKALSGAISSFIDPLAVYTNAVKTKADADQEAARVAGMSKAQEKWSQDDWIAHTQLTTKQYLDQLQKQVDDQTNWSSNLVLLAGRASAGTLEYLAELGPKGAPLVAQLVNSSDAEMIRMNQLMDQRSASSTEAVRRNIEDAGPMWKAVMASGGQGAVDSLEAKLRSGQTTLDQIMTDYRNTLAGGMNPVLAALGKDQIAFFSGPGVGPSRVGRMADGGWISGGSGPRADDVPLWGSGGEFVVNAKSADKHASALEWINADKYADGGWIGAEDVPRPPSTAPFQPPISTAEAATTQRMYDEVRKWLATTASGGPNSWGVVPWLAALGNVGRNQFGFGTIGTYGGHQPDQQHALDFMISNAAQGNAFSAFVSSNAARFGVQYEIWQQRIWNADRAGEGWRGMADRGSPTQNHMDHVHVSAKFAAPMGLYDDGGVLKPGATLAMNGTGENEYVLRKSQFANLVAGRSTSDMALVEEFRKLRVSLKNSTIAQSNTFVGVDARSAMSEANRELAWRMAR